MAGISAPTARLNLTLNLNLNPFRYLNLELENLDWVGRGLRTS